MIPSIIICVSPLSNRGSMLAVKYQGFGGGALQMFTSRTIRAYDAVELLKSGKWRIPNEFETGAFKMGWSSIQDALKKL